MNFDLRNQHRGRILRAFTALAVSAAMAAALSGCSSDPEPTSPAPSSESTSSSPAASSSSPKQSSSPEEPAEARPDLAISISGEEVLPNAEEISIDTGEALVISFASDRPGELHVHSKPEQVLEFPAGKSEQELVIETPGIVEIEEHETGAVVAQLKVGG